MLHRSGVIIFPLCFSMLSCSWTEYSCGNKSLLLKYFIGIFQMLTRALPLKQRSRLLFITDDIQLSIHTQGQKERKHCLF